MKTLLDGGALLKMVLLCQYTLLMILAIEPVR